MPILQSAPRVSRRFEAMLPRLLGSDRAVHYIGHRGRRLGFLIDPAMVEAVLTHGAAHFDKGADTQYWRSAIGDGTGIRPPLGHVDPGAPDGQDLVSWRRFRRRALAHHFSRTRLDGYRAASAVEAERLFSAWARDPVRDLAADARELAVANFVACFAPGAAREPLRHASRVVFEGRFAAKAAVDSPMLCPYDRNLSRGQRIWQLLQTLRRPGLRMVARRTRVLGRTFRELADQCAKAPAPDDLFAALADAASGYDSGIPRRTLPGQMQGLFIAGTETVSSALTWLLWHLVADPDLQERVAAEPPASTLLHACIHESLRLHPPAWSIPREALCRVRVGGEVIERGTVLVASPLIQHYQTRSYLEPEAFRPERFLDPPKPTGRYYPFSLGLRTCPAMQFTLTQVAQITRQILGSWRLEATCANPPMPRHWLGLDLGLDPGQAVVSFRVTPR
jgi:cytochrome P450